MARLSRTSTGIVNVDARASAQDIWQWPDNTSLSRTFRIERWHRDDEAAVPHADIITPLPPIINAEDDSPRTASWCRAAECIALAPRALVLHGRIDTLLAE